MYVPLYLQAAQRDGGQPDVEQHAPSLATSAAGRRLRASRHNSALRAPKAPQPLHLCALRQPASITVKAYSLSARTQLSTENRQSKYFSCLENCPFT